MVFFFVTKWVKHPPKYLQKRKKGNKLMDWKVGDRFFVSGIADLDTHSPRIRATGEIVELLHNKKALVILDKLGDETKVPAIVRIRHMREER